MLQPLEVKDFSGGMTDFYLAGPSNRGQLFENLLINNNKKPYTRPGSEIRDETYSQIPSGVRRIGYLWNHRDQILEQSERNVYYVSGAYNTLFGPTANPVFSANAESNHISVAYWNNHSILVSDSFAKPMKVFKDASGVFRAVAAGLPAIADPVVTAGAAGANNYIYAFHYYYSYNVEGVTFEDSGTTAQVALASAAAPNTNAVAITAIPVISNGLTDNYDTTVIKVKIFRTQNNGTVFNYVGEVTNGTTIYNDNASDASIVNNVLLYTTGDVVDNDTPPAAKFVHVADDIAVYGYVKEAGIEVPNRVRYSIPGDIDSCPEDFFDDYPDTITGISSLQGTFIIFCKSSVFRAEGFFDEQGRGGVSHLKISDTVGAVSNDSIVQTDEGIFFASQSGFYFCDGYKVTPVSEHLSETYKTLVEETTQARNIFGAYDKNEKRVWWAIQRDSSSLDNDSCIILDTSLGISPESTFTTASNETSFAPTALLFKDGDMYRGDRRGYVFRHDSNLFSDPRVDVNAVPIDWSTKTIIHDYKSCAFDFGTSFVRKFVSEILVSLANITNIAIQVFSNNDDGRKVAALVEIKNNSNIVWGDNTVVWGDATIRWNMSGLVEAKRKFPAKGLRCNYKQIRITNSHTIVCNSDLYGLVTADPVSNTVTLVNADSIWPEEVVGYFLTFVSDGYVKEYEVIERVSDTVLTLLDPPNTVPAAGDYKWLLKGFRKNEKMELLSYVIQYKMLTDSQRAYRTSDSGENA